jgi:type IV secretory pathway TraG/TraD family ATPase VirD4
MAETDRDDGPLSPYGSRSVTAASRRGSALGYAMDYGLPWRLAQDHLSIIETTWALVRGYGIQLVPVLQDLNQLKELYKERWETFIGMAGVVEAFGPNDLTTADWLSRRSGDSTEVVMGYNISQSAGGPSEGVNYHQVKIPRLTPHELFDTPEGHAHVFLANMAKPGADVRAGLLRDRHGSRAGARQSLLHWLSRVC